MKTLIEPKIQLVRLVRGIRRIPLFPRIAKRRPSAAGPCGPCVPGLPSPTWGPGAGLWPSGAGIAGSFIEGPVGPIIGPDSPPPAPRQGPDPVDFGTSGDFKILAKSGISNIAPSQVIGDIGVSPIDSTAITGFALVLDGSGQFAVSAQVVGLVYAANYSPPTPAKMTQAILDMEAAYTDAAGRPADFVDVGAGLLGGLNLIPGVYAFSSNVQILTNLTLTGGPDDTWIFQIPGTLDVASAVQIVMAGGAQARNVFWQVAGATTVGTNATFRGNILDLTNIAIQTGASVYGKLQAQTAVTLDQNFVNG